VSNRGDSAEDHLSIFAREADGTLRFVKWVPSGGRGPRHFSLSLDSAAHLLVVGHQQGENLVLFERDARTGDLTRLDRLVNAGLVAYAGFAPF
jgi:6-phosphogluconolactonase